MQNVKIQNANTIKIDLEEIVKWSDRWQIPLSIKKCKVMHTGNSNPRTDYEIKSEKI